MPTPKKHSAKRAVSIFVMAIVIAVTLSAAWFLMGHMRSNPLSEDAIISAEVVHISPAIPGQLEAIFVEEGARVKRGAELFHLDPLVYQLQVRQAEAQLAMTQSALTTHGKQIRAETANATIADEQITRARTNLALAESTLRRLTPLAAKGYVTEQELDTAKTTAHDARVSLSQAQSQSKAAANLIGHIDGSEAAVRNAEATLGLARKALDDTVVHAPNDGLVVGLNVSAGERLLGGQSLFTLINTETWHATGFFIETELDNIKVGNCASVFVLSNPKEELTGRVSNIGWGVGNSEMVSLPRSLPYVQKSLNWVHVAQRFPVRVELKSPPPELMRMGASATVVIRPTQDCE